jgi:hypothetical protein
MLALPDRRCVVALDPTLFHLKDPELYRLWARIPRQPPPDVAEVIRRRFGARYVACFWDERFRAFMHQIAFEPGVRTVVFTEDWSVYEIGEPDAGDGGNAVPADEAEPPSSAGAPSATGGDPTP